MRKMTIAGTPGTLAMTLAAHLGRSRNHRDVFEHQAADARFDHLAAAQSDKGSDIGAIDRDAINDAGRFEATSPAFATRTSGVDAQGRTHAGQPRHQQSTTISAMIKDMSAKAAGQFFGRQAQPAFLAG